MDIRFRLSMLMFKPAGFSARFMVQLGAITAIGKIERNALPSAPRVETTQIAATLRIIGLAHTPSGVSLRAKPPVRVHIAAGSIEICYDPKAVLFAPEFIARAGSNVDLISSGSKRKPVAGDNLASLADLNFGLAFAISVQVDFHAPQANALSLRDRVGGNVEVFNPETVTTTTTVASAIGGKGIGCNRQQKTPEKRAQPSFLRQKHLSSPFFR
jgi:hypothetical protein